MPYRKLRRTGLFFHVLNRAARRDRLFHTDGDYQGFLRVLIEGHRRTPVDLMAYCVMPNHFHLVVKSDDTNRLSAFMQWCTGTHSKRWHVWNGSTGTGPVYQGRFKSFPIQSDPHFLTVCRYVEANPVRAGLVKHAADWPWSSLAQRGGLSNDVPLCAWPLPQPDDWIELVNGKEPASELDRIRRAVRTAGLFG